MQFGYAAQAGYKGGGYSKGWETGQATELNPSHQEW